MSGTKDTRCLQRRSDKGGYKGGGPEGPVDEGIKKTDNSMMAVAWLFSTL